MDRGYLVERKPHPKDIASIWSLLFFSYIHPYIKKGNERPLNEDDVSKIWSTLQSKKLGDKMERLWDAQIVEKGKKKSLTKLLFDCFWKKYLVLGIFQLIVKILYVVSTPIAVGKFVNYFKEGQTEVTRNEAWVYGGIVVLTNSGYLFYEHHYILLKNEMGLEIVTSLSSMIYRKILKLSPSKMAEISTGKIVTAITKDVAQLDIAVYYMNDIWVDLVQALVIIFLLYAKLGTSGITGLSSIFIILVIQIFVAKNVFKKRKSANNKSDERLQLTQEIITSIRVMKMYAWETFFGKKIINKRKNEIRELRMLLILKFFSNFLGSICRKLSFLLVLLCYIWFGHSLTSEVVYYITTCFYRLSRTISHLIPICLGTGAELIACMNRIESILTAEEIEEIIQDDSNLVIIPKVDFVSVDVGFSNFPILKDVNMKLKPGLNVLIGPVGCGKSSLLKAILREYVILNGKVNIEGSISYCPQNPWLFPSSIKQNIIFGQPFTESKYKTILNSCALSFDLDGLAEGDETVLNDCGVNLSKGQQARVNIARALYKDSNIYILDDCLSALDSHVKNFIFSNSIQNYLKDKMVILATHDKKFVDKADNVIIMQDGTVTYSGKPTDIPLKVAESLESLDKDLYDSDEENDQESKEGEEEIPCNEDTDLIAKICTSNKANVYHETLITGGIKWKDYKKYFSFGGGFYMFFLVFAIAITVEICYGYSEKLLSKWVLMEEKMSLHLSSSNSNLTKSLSNVLNQTVTPYLLEDETFTETTEGITENYTALSSKMKMNNLSTTLDFLEQRESFVYLYSNLLFASTLLFFIGTVLYFIFSLKISKNLHNAMITKVLGAKMSFFDMNMSGNILNRFSKDLYDIDEWIPFIINEAIRMATLLTTSGILISSISTFFSIMTVILVVIFFFACRYCIKPGRNLRRLCTATRSPVVGHLNATLEGLITIRAYGTQSILVNEFDKHQDLLIASHHLFEILMRCLAFTLHMFAAGYVSLIVLKFLIADVESSSSVGLAITQSFVLSNYLDWGLRQWVMLESIMTSFQRAAQYTDIKQEIQTGQTVENWPSEGCIKYQNVTLKYRANNETVLKNLNFVIKPKEKIGIVGRTGAGKSSIVVTLFRLYEVEGDILIDDVNIKTLPLDFLRNHIGIIPQDPILFSGTVRVNIDPLGRHSDDDIWQALNAVNLKSAIMDLDEDVHECGLTHSVGQRQLICLARAIIRKTKIIILDEATANMDEETDKFVHDKINELFEHCTTITVAHRLNSVMRCDRVIVMDNGEIIEFENPNTLLENKDSTFFKMVHHHDNS